MEAQHTCQVYLAPEEMGLVGYPAFSLLVETVPSLEEFFEQKVKPSTSRFRLCPKILSLKQPNRLTANYLEELKRQA
jgi:hypothetical protein